MDFDVLFAEQVVDLVIAERDGGAELALVLGEVPGDVGGVDGDIFDATGIDVFHELGEGEIVGLPGVALLDHGPQQEDCADDHYPENRGFYVRVHSLSRTLARGSIPLKQAALHHKTPQVSRLIHRGHPLYTSTEVYSGLEPDLGQTNTLSAQRHSRPAATAEAGPKRADQTIRSPTARIGQPARFHEGMRVR